MEIKKLDDNRIEVETTEVKKTILTMENLLLDRDGLVRTIENNIIDMTNVNKKIQAEIDEIDLKIAECNKLGIKTMEEINKDNYVQSVILDEELIKE
jgi:hypothetical protein